MRKVRTIKPRAARQKEEEKKTEGQKKPEEKKEVSAQNSQAEAVQEKASEVSVEQTAEKKVDSAQDAGEKKDAVASEKPAQKNFRSKSNRNNSRNKPSSNRPPQPKKEFKVKVIQGEKLEKSVRVAVIVGRFNENITKRMLDSCLEELTKSGIKESDILVVWVPGAFEIPLMAKQLSQKSSIKSVICLGCVIKGETYHFDLVAQQSAEGLMNVALASEKPIVFEVLACDNMSQADARTKPQGRNKGKSAAQVAVEMISNQIQLGKIRS